MKNILLFYVIAQLISTAYGVAVIESVRPFVKAKLHDEGYVKKNRNSLYKYSSDIVDVLKGFIPFYYAIVAVNLINSKDPLKKAVKDEIDSGEYITREEAEFLRNQDEENKNNSINLAQPEIVYEKPERYTARKNDNTLYDTYITPVEYIIHDASENDELNLTPWLDKDRVVEHVMVKEEPTKGDIVKTLFELNLDEFNQFKETIPEVERIIREKEKTRELNKTANKTNPFGLKDVA